MKKIYTLCLFLMASSVWPQGQLVRGNAELEINENKAHIKQYLDVDLSDSTKTLKLKMLVFERSSLLQVAISLDGQQLYIKKQEKNGLITIPITLPKGKSTKRLQLNYTIATETEDRYIPFFFTELPAKGSDNNFFPVQFRFSETQGYTLHFPDVATEEHLKDGLKEIHFELPALISVMRLELHPKAIPQLGFAQLMDGLVLLVFVIMGVVIWFNRKHLVYG